MTYKLVDGISLLDTSSITCSTNTSTTCSTTCSTACSFDATMTFYNLATAP